jgi:hypothetical protein
MRCGFLAAAQLVAPSKEIEKNEIFRLSYYLDAAGIECGSARALA